MKIKKRITAIIAGIFLAGSFGTLNQVFLNGEIKTFVTGQIELCTPKAKYNWVDVDTFQSSLSSYQINNPSASNLYSLNAARIDFVPYQFRPALKIINSDEPRILIADSVGVGKTIEAGLIIKELDAREELEKIMIICPKPLVAEHKWRDEMHRFDEDFEELDGRGLRQLISDMDTYGEWSPRHNKVIVPYSMQSYLKGTTRTPRLTFLKTEKVCASVSAKVFTIQMPRITPVGSTRR